MPANGMCERDIDAQISLSQLKCTQITTKCTVSRSTHHTANKSDKSAHVIVTSNDRQKHRHYFDDIFCMPRLQVRNANACCAHYAYRTKQQMKADGKKKSHTTSTRKGNRLLVVVHLLLLMSTAHCIVLTNFVVVRCAGTLRTISM